MIEIRVAAMHDDDALRRIDEVTWGPQVTPAPAPDPKRPFFGEHRTPEDILVAEVDGSVVGYAGVHQGLPIPSHDHVLELNGLAVDPARQRLGVARALVAAAVEEARRRGARKLSLRVLAPNAAARRLYEGCGFVVEGVLQGEFILDGTPVDDVLMARPVD